MPWPVWRVGCSAPALYVLDDAPGEGPDVGAAVAPDLGLVPYPAEGDTVKTAAQGTGDGSSQRRFSGSRRAGKTEDRPLGIGLEFTHRQVFDDPFLGFLQPEVIVVEAEPTSYPRAPISKKRVWFDARTLLPVNMVSYDRRGEPFKSFDGTYSMYENGDKKVMDGNRPYWSWCNVHAHNVQSDRMTRLVQVKNLRGYEMRVNDQSIYEDYLTIQALRRMGT